LLHVPASLAFDRVKARLGISLYGLTAPANDLDLRPVMSLTSRVTQIKTVAPGTTVSYNRTWRADSPTRIATIGAGYADGYLRKLSNRAEVGIGGQRYPVAGTVCMDMFMVSLGDPDGPGAGVQEGDEVVLFGTGGPSALDIAAWAETIPYEICCGIAARVPRRYVD
jgi:alanine racemase